MGPRGSARPSLGALEKSVAWIESTPHEKFSQEMPRKVQKLKGEKLEALLRSAALAALRSVDVGRSHDGVLAHGWLVQPSVQSLLAELVAGGRPEEIETARHAVQEALLLTNREIQGQPGGPIHLPDFGPAVGAKEDTLFAFLEEVRSGNADGADQRFSWLVGDLEKGPLVDMLLSTGLEGAADEVHKLVGVVEGSALLQWMGWEWAPVALRTVVRHQASGRHALVEYDRCREDVESRDLLRLARRRPPGQPALGERDPAGFFQRAVEWAEADPDARRVLARDALAEGVTLEDFGEVLELSATLLLLQETMRTATEPWSLERADQLTHLVTGSRAIVRVLRLGTPGQRVLAFLLAGYLPVLRDLQLTPRAPDAGWWLSPASRLLERWGDTSAAPPSPAWMEAIQIGRPNGLLPLVAEQLEAGRSLDTWAAEPRDLVARQRTMGSLAVKLERALIGAYRGARSPHRWVHVWAAGLAAAQWPRNARAGDP